MRRWHAVVVMTLLAASMLARASSFAGSDVPPVEDADLRSLVAAERAFALLSIKKGMREAFLANLAADAIVFRPGPVQAVPWFEQRPASPGRLEWEPDFAAVSAAGDLGYTSGPWWYREKPEDEPLTGHFVSVWRRASHGMWKVVFDGGIRHEPPSGPRGMAYGPRRELRGAGSDPAAVQRELLLAERSLADRAAASGWLEAFAAHAADDVRAYFPGEVPAVGRPAARSMLARHDATWTWSPQAAIGSSRGDLGFVYGVAERHPNGAPPDSVESSAWVRIWRKGESDEFEIVLDLTTPMPPATPPPAVPQRND